MKDIEVRVIDAESGKVLFEGVDARVGGRNMGKGMDDWADVNNGFHWYAKLSRYRLCRQRGDSDCVPPQQ